MPEMTNYRNGAQIGGCQGLGGMEGGGGCGYRRRVLVGMEMFSTLTVSM